MQNCRRISPVFIFAIALSYLPFLLYFFSIFSIKRRIINNNSNLPNE